VLNTRCTVVVVLSAVTNIDENWAKDEKFANNFHINMASKAVRHEVLADRAALSITYIVIAGTINISKILFRSITRSCGLLQTVHSFHQLCHGRPKKS